MILILVLWCDRKNMRDVSKLYIWICFPCRLEECFDEGDSCAISLVIIIWLNICKTLNTSFSFLSLKQYYLYLPLFYVPVGIKKLRAYSKLYLFFGYLFVCGSILSLNMRNIPYVSTYLQQWCNRLHTFLDPYVLRN